jgi:hypothetical protein
VAPLLDDGPESRRGRYADRRGLTAIDGANVLIGVVLVTQMWLLSAALEASLAGHDDVSLPAAIGSGVLAALCLLLFRYVGRVDREMRGG